MAHPDSYPRAATRRVLLLGLPGSGKSTLAASLAAKYKLKWIDLENSRDTIAALPKEWKDNIDYISLPDCATYPVAHNTLFQLFSNFKGTICYMHGIYDCASCAKAGHEPFSIDIRAMGQDEALVIDTLTQLSSSVLASVTKGKVVDYKLQTDDWGALRKNNEFYASQIQVLPCNFIGITHIEEAQLEDGKSKLVPNFGSRNMCAQFGKYFSDIIYTEVVNKKHRAFGSSTASNNVITRSRSNFKIEDLDVPNLLPLFESLTPAGESAAPYVEPAKVLGNAIAASGVAVGNTSKYTSGKQTAAEILARAQKGST